MQVNEDAVPADADAAAKDPVQAEQARLKDTFIDNFMHFCSSTLLVENSDIIVEIKILALDILISSRVVNYYIHTIKGIIVAVNYISNIFCSGSLSTSGRMWTPF